VFENPILSAVLVVLTPIVGALARRYAPAILERVERAFNKKAAPVKPVKKHRRAKKRKKKATKRPIGFRLAT
jgi:hypothetical protein